jgi:hypothetical protein
MINFVFKLIKMKKALFTILLSVSVISFSKAQTSVNTNQSLDKRDNWTQKDLIEPAALAAIIANPKAKQPLIYNIGVVENIKGAKNFGAASEKENLERLRKTLSGIPKTSFLVVYCGCCPFSRCPNIRPAIGMLKTMGFTNGKLLNIPTNLKQNWIDKGYPLAGK